MKWYRAKKMGDSTDEGLNMRYFSYEQDWHGTWYPPQSCYGTIHRPRFTSPPPIIYQSFTVLSVDSCSFTFSISYHSCLASSILIAYQAFAELPPNGNFQLASDYCQWAAPRSNFSRIVTEFQSPATIICIVRSFHQPALIIQPE